MVALCALKNLYTALSYGHFVSLCLCAVVPDDIIIVSGSKVALSRGGQVSEPARLRSRVSEPGFFTRARINFFYSPESVKSRIYLSFSPGFSQAEAPDRQSVRRLSYTLVC